MTVHPFEPPIATNLSCRNCGDPIVATGQVVDGGMTIKGLREYRWTHAHGSDTCLPKTVAQPFDGWRATREVEAVQADRRAAEDALVDVMEAFCNWCPDPQHPTPAHHPGGQPEHQPEEA